MKESRVVQRLKQQRVLGVDIDHPTGFRLLKSYFNLAYMAAGKPIHVYKTPSGGFHLEAYGLKTNLDARRLLQDCRGRLFFSELRKGDDVTFDRKFYPGDWGWSERVEIPVENLWRNLSWKISVEEVT